MPKYLLWCIIVLSAHAMEPFQEQTPLEMTTPNTAKDKSIKWIPLTSNAQKTPQKSTKISTKSIDDSIKNQIQKKIQTLLTSPKDEGEDQ